MHTLTFTEINLSRLVGAAQLESLPCSSRALQSTTAAIVGKSDLDELSCLNFPNFGQKRTWIQDPRIPLFSNYDWTLALCISMHHHCLFFTRQYGQCVDLRGCIV